MRRIFMIAMFGMAMSCVGQTSAPSPTGNAGGPNEAQPEPVFEEGIEVPVQLDPARPHAPPPGERELAHRLPTP